MSDYIPESVVLEILYSLPPNSLVKCTSVCKSWYSIIKSPTFISSHLQRSLSRPTPSLFLIRHFSPSHLKEHYSLCSDASTFRRIAKLESPFLARGKFFFRFVGAVNGVVCLSDDLFGYQSVIILWNPLIQRHVELPKPNFTFDSLGGRYMFVIGFGFDSRKNDYKVVRVCYRQGDDGRDVVPPKVELYSLNQGSWRVIDASYLQLRVVGFAWTQCFLHGNVHWPAYGQKQKNDPFQNCVLMFNVEEDKFKKMKLPEELVSILPLSLVISVIEGCLSVIDYHTLISGCNIWMRREYGMAKSWSKMYSVNLWGGVGKALGVRASGDVLVIPNGELVSLHSFDPKSQEMRDLRIRGVIEGFCACDYTGSLVLLDKKSAASSCPGTKRCVLWDQDDESTRLDSDDIDSNEEMASDEVRKYLKINEGIHFGYQMAKFGLPSM